MNMDEGTRLCKRQNGIVAKDLVLWKVSDIRVYLQHLLSHS